MQLLFSPIYRSIWNNVHVVIDMKIIEGCLWADTNVLHLESLTAH